MKINVDSEVTMDGNKGIGKRVNQMHKKLRFNDSQVVVMVNIYNTWLKLDCGAWNSKESLDFMQLQYDKPMKIRIEGLDTRDAKILLK